ncbi:MAG: TonB-dependent receptor [Bacteroidetes bacterium]|nr:TonB-dependent receptor [Bacteroidota bacterium]
MRYLPHFLTSVGLMVALVSLSQSARIYGTVTDEKDNSPIFGVAIQVKGTTNGTQTDVDGKYELKVEQGTHMLQLSYVGYSKRSIPVTMLSVKEKRQDIKMAAEANELDMVVVTGTKYEKVLGEEVVSMEILKASVINQNSARMDEAMQKVPGVNMLGKTISIRGGSGFSDVTGNRVMVLLDEMPVIGPENGGIIWDMIPIEALEQIEVIKGCASAFYGSSALNGVINMRTVNPKPEMVNKVLINYGFYGQPRQRTWNQGWKKGVIKKNGDTVSRISRPMFGGAQIMHAKQYGDFGVVLAGGYQQDQGFRMNNDYKQARLTSKLRYTPHKLPNLTVGLNMNLYHQTSKDFFASKGVATLTYVPIDFTQTKERTLIFDPYVNLYDKKDNRHSLKFRYYNTLRYSTTGDSSLAHQFYYDYTYLRKFKKYDLILTAGSNGYYSLIEGKTFGELTSNIRNIKYFNTRDVMNFSAFVQVEKKFFKRLTVSAGLRLEYARLSGHTIQNRLPFINLLHHLRNKETDIQSPVTPLFRCGLNYQATQGTFLRASFGQGFRFPSLAEKYVYTIRSFAQAFPNDSLRPENGWSAEIGIKQAVKVSNWIAYFDLSGYVMRYHDMIEFQVYENYPDSFQLYGVPFRAVNIVNTVIAGAEISAVANGKIFGVPLNFLIGYSYLYPRNLDYNPADANSTKLLKYRVQHSAKADLQVTYKGVILGVSAFYNSFIKEVDNLSVGALPVVTKFRATHNKGDFVMSLRAGYNYKDKVSFTFICKNVLNTEYTLRPALIEAPRNFTFQVGYNF